MGKIGDIVQKVRAMLPGDSVSMDEAYKTGVAFSVKVPLEKLRDVAAACNEDGFYLESLTALDFQDTAEMVYHMNCYEPRSRFVIRVLCGHGQTVPTVSDYFPTADWQEREVHEFFGIRFADHPDLRRLLLPEDADYYPLKKSFGIVHAYRKREDIYG